MNLLQVKTFFLGEMQQEDVINQQNALNEELLQGLNNPYAIQEYPTRNGVAGSGFEEADQMVVGGNADKSRDSSLQTIEKFFYDRKKSRPVPHGIQGLDFQLED